MMPVICHNPIWQCYLQPMLLPMVPRAIYARRNASLKGQALVCVYFLPIHSGHQVGRTSRGHTGGRPHRISHPPSFCGACLHFLARRIQPLLSLVDREVEFRVVVVVVVVFTLKTVLTSIQYPSHSYSSRQRNEFPWSQANPK